MKHLDGKVVVVTGANAGVGFETARQLYEHGATVVLASRDRLRGDAAVAAICGRDSGGDSRAVCMQLDLAHFESVRSFVRQFHERFGRDNLHGLVCSAGVNSAGAKLQGSIRFRDNVNFVFRVNFTSHALLALLLLDDLRASATKLCPSKIVAVSSHMHCFCPPDTQWRSVAADPAASAYSESKLALLLFASALHHREAANHVQCTVVNPGAVASQIWRNSSALIQWLSEALFLTPALGAGPSVSCFLTETHERTPSVRCLAPYVDIARLCGFSACFSLKLQAAMEALGGRLLAFRGPQEWRVSRTAKDRGEAFRLFAEVEELLSEELPKK